MSTDLSRIRAYLRLVKTDSSGRTLDIDEAEQAIKDLANAIKMTAMEDMVTAYYMLLYPGDCLHGTNCCHYS